MMGTETNSSSQFFGRPVDSWTYNIKASPFTYGTSATSFTIPTPGRLDRLIALFNDIPESKLERAARFVKVFLKMGDRMDLLVAGGLSELIDEKTIAEFVSDVFGIPVSVTIEEPANGQKVGDDSANANTGKQEHL